MTDSNVIYIGSKPAMSYVLVVLTAFNNSKDGITLKARGQAIISAINVTELCRNRFLSDMAKPEVEIGTDVVDSDGHPRNVSAISIRLTRAEAKPEKTPPAPAEKHDLSDIKGVGPATAEKLKSAGYKYAEDVAKASVEEFSGKTGLGEAQSSKIIAAAKTF